VKTAFNSGCTNTSAACWPCVATAADLSADCWYSFTLRELRRGTVLSVSFKQCRGSSLVSMGMRIQPFISMRIRIRILIQAAKPMRIQADPDPDHTFESQKVEFLDENILM
jgi:hypothetical protein